MVISQHEITEGLWEYLFYQIEKDLVTLERIVSIIKFSEMPVF